MRQEHKEHVHRTFYYAPRMFALLVGLFFLLMLTDLKPGFGLWDFLVHFLPGAIVILAILLTWNRPRLASVVFAALCLVYTLVGWVYIQDGVIGIITVPLIIVSALLILNVKSRTLV